MSATFAVVTDDVTYVQGQTFELFAELGHAQARLDTYSEAGTYIQLEFAGGLTLTIPEYRIKYIAEAAPSSV